VALEMTTRTMSAGVAGLIWNRRAGASRGGSGGILVYIRAGQSKGLLSLVDV
jgi:hypothetical protein